MKKELLIIVGIALVAVAAMTYKLAGVPGAYEAGLAAPPVPDEAPPAGKQAGAFRVLLVGDILVGAVRGEGLESRIAGYEKLLGSADLWIGALASPLEAAAKGASAAKAAGLYGVSLATPRMASRGAAGLEETVSALDAAGIAWWGAGRSDEESVRVQRLEKKVGAATFRMALLGATVSAPEIGAADSWRVNELDVARLSDQIRALKKEDPATLVVVSIAWGKPYRWVEKDQRVAGRALAQAGADFVVGHGMRTMQQVEPVGTSWVVYGTGQFAAGDPAAPASTRNAVPPFGLAVALDVRPSGAALETTARAYPIAFDGGREVAKGRVVTAKEFGEALWLLVLEANGWAPQIKKWLTVGKDGVGHYIELKHGRSAR